MQLKCFGVMFLNFNVLINDYIKHVFIFRNIVKLNARLILEFPTKYTYAYITRLMYFILKLTSFDSLRNDYIV